MTLRKVAAAAFSTFLLCCSPPAFARGGSGAVGGHGGAVAGHGFGHAGGQGFGHGFGRGFAAPTVGRATVFNARAGQAFTGRSSYGRAFAHGGRGRGAYGRRGSFVGGDGPSPVADAYQPACGSAVYDAPRGERLPVVIYGIAPACAPQGGGPGVYYMN